MASKTYELEPLGKVTVVKRQANRHLRLTIASGGQIRVSIPTWASYQAGLDFALSKQAWITDKLPPVNLLSDGQSIGRAHRLVFKADATTTKPRTRIKGNQITISYPKALSPQDTLVQTAANSAAVKALRAQAISLLPQRLEALSKSHGLPYTSVQIKQLSRRWGSCDQKQRIVLNLYLIQMPWELIDYVILHELAHTRHMNHGPEFWKLLIDLSPNARSLKKQLGKYHPGIVSI